MLSLFYYREYFSVSSDVPDIVHIPKIAYNQNTLSDPHIHLL